MKKYHFFSMPTLIGGGEYETDDEAIKQGLLYADSIGEILGGIDECIPGLPRRKIWNIRDGVTDPDEMKVLEALATPNSTWRTVWAIVRQTGLPEARVQTILAKYDLTLIRQSETPSISGSALVGLIEKVGAVSTKTTVRSSIAKLYRAKDQAFNEFNGAIGTPREAMMQSRFWEARRKYETALAKHNALHNDV